MSYDDPIPVSEQAREEAAIFFKTLDGTEPPTSTGEANDGDLCFFWQTDRVFIDLGFYGDETYSCYAQCKETGQEWFIDDAPPSQPLPIELQNLITPRK